MPRLSLYKPTKGNDDKFINRTMSEMFTVGGVDVYVHKYLGPLAQTNTSATESGATGIMGIQDLLFLENRDRKYDTSVYTMRTIYRINDNDFDLQQFGLFLTGDTMFAVVHYDDMIDIIGRKLMVGDVLELPNLIDYYPLDEGVGAALKRFYVVNDASRAAEGFAQTWWPHLWRVKLQPLVDSQEYKDILNNLPASNDETNTNTLGEVISTYNKYIEINDAIVTRAEQDVPKSGYDTSTFYTENVNAHGLPVDPGALDASDMSPDASSNVADASAQTLTSAVKIEGYLTGDALPPNGATVAAGIAFPATPGQGDYYLRLDYIPNRLFRYDGRRWVKVEDSVRTNLTPGTENQTQLSGFINDTNQFMSNGAAWDSIRISNSYVPPANAATLSFTLATKTVVVKVPYNSTYGARTKLDGLPITNTISNSSGNIAVTITGPLYPRKLRITSATAMGGNATVRFASQPTTPFVVGQDILIAGVAGSTAFNGSYVVTSANASSASYTLAGNLTGVVSSATIADASPLPIGSVLEYTIYRNVVNERQSLSQALRPSADN
jgi:hypothetical protein